MAFPLSQLLNKMVSGYLPAEAQRYQEHPPSHQLAPSLPLNYRARIQREY